MVFVTFVAGSSFPGAQYTDDQYENFMDWGFQSMGVPKIAAGWLVFPGEFAMAWGFVLPYGRLLHSMSKSNILPSYLCLMSQKTDHLAVIVGSVFSYLLCLLSFYNPSINLNLIPILLSFVIYISDFYAYYRMKTDFSNIQRDYRSPFGVPGAVFGSLVFGFGLISSIGFSGDYWTIVYVIGMFVLLSIYYVGFAHNAQIFSAEEQQSLVVLHVILFNKRKRMRMAKGNRGPNKIVSNSGATGKKKKNHSY
jgi:ethanolamine permease